MLEITSKMNTKINIIIDFKKDYYSKYHLSN